LVELSSTTTRYIAFLGKIYYWFSTLSRYSLFGFSVPSWCNFSRFCVSRNLSISCRLFNFLAYNYSVYFLQSSYFYKINGDIPTFISDFGDLSHLSVVFFCPSRWRYVNFVVLLKETTFGFTDFLYCFAIIYFIDLSSDLYYFIPSASFELVYFSFSIVLSYKGRLFIWDLFDF
jgi:hypothetical protein